LLNQTFLDALTDGGFPPVGTLSPRIDLFSELSQVDASIEAES
jgi:hypothetical protein